VSDQGQAERAPPGGGWRQWVVTLGGAGFSPVASGTAGSFVAIVILGAARWAVPCDSRELWIWNGILVLGVVVYSALCVMLGPWTIRQYGRKDPGQCVLDEGAGICLTGLFVPMGVGWRSVYVLAAVFFTFRVFDVLKPPPARRLERLPQGWGILVDDLAAAVYANVVCQVLFRVVI
jgi:phosphatidylglycerophosphatase A